MANQEHLEILRQGVDVWNEWRKQHPDIKPDLCEAKLEKFDLSEANLSEVQLREANLREANLTKANMNGADLRWAILNKAQCKEASFREAHLRGAHLMSTVLVNADLSGAHLEASYLMWAKLNGALLEASFLSWVDLSEADLSKANLTGCFIYAISAWNVRLEGAIQSGLIITKEGEPTITVDNLEVAQFIYLLLNNQKIREVIDTITSKVVLILGRFKDEQKAVLNVLRDELRKRNYSPVLFDFEKPASRDITETISTLAHIARFVIADLTDAKSIPQELMRIVPNLPSVPVQPLILSSQREYGMFEHFTRFPWVLPIYHYADEGSLLQSLKEQVIDPVERKAQELAQK